MGAVQVLFHKLCEFLEGVCSLRRPTDPLNPACSSSPCFIHPSSLPYLYNDASAATDWVKQRRSRGRAIYVIYKRLTVGEKRMPRLPKLLRLVSTTACNASPTLGVHQAGEEESIGVSRSEEREEEGLERNQRSLCHMSLGRLRIGRGCSCLSG